MSRIKKVWAYGAAALAGIAGVVKFFSVNKIENSDLAFLLFVVQRLIPELLCLSLLVLILAVPPILWYGVAGFAKKAFVVPAHFWRGKTGIAVALSLVLWISLIILCIPLGRSVVTDVRLRAIYDRDFILQDYRNLLIRRALIYERFGQLDQAAGICRQITSTFKGPKWESKNNTVDRKRDYLAAKMAYAQTCWTEALKKSTDLPTRDRWFLALKATSIFPQSDYLARVEVWHSKLKSASGSPTALYQAARSGDTRRLADIYRDWAWYLFDEATRQSFDADLRSNRLAEKMSTATRNMADLEFRNLVEDSWQLAKGEVVIENAKKLQRTVADNQFLHELETSVDLPNQLQEEDSSAGMKGLEHVGEADDDRSLQPQDTVTDYPTAMPVLGRPGFVHSPYAPTRGYVDVRGMAAGSQARCPYTGRTFIIPGDSPTHAVTTGINAR